MGSKIKNQAATNIKTLIKAFWKFTKEMWHKRNTQQHNETIPHFNFKRLQILSEIEQLYDNQDHMLFNDTELFSVPLATREKNTPQCNFKPFTQWQKTSNGKALQMQKHLEKNIKK